MSHRTTTQTVVFGFKRLHMTTDERQQRRTRRGGEPTATTDVLAKNTPRFPPDPTTTQLDIMLLLLLKVRPQVLISPDTLSASILHPFQEVQREVTRLTTHFLKHETVIGRPLLPTIVLTLISCQSFHHVTLSDRHPQLSRVNPESVRFAAGTP